MRLPELMAAESLSGVSWFGQGCSRPRGCCWAPRWRAPSADGKGASCASSSSWIGTGVAGLDRGDDAGLR